MNYIILVFVASTILFVNPKSVSSQCQYEDKISLAKKNMNELDRGLTCANVAQFYSLLCKCTNTPQSEEEAIKLHNQILAIRKAYYTYGVKCENFEELLPDDIPNCLIREVSKIFMSSQIDDNNNVTYELFDQNGQLITNPEAIQDILENPENNEIVGSYGSKLEDDDIIDIINSLGGNGSSWVNPSQGSCNMAAYNKFGNSSWSSRAAESAATRYEGYRCHCVNGTLQDGFTDASFDPDPLDTDQALVQIKRLRKNYYNVKKPRDPDVSPLPSKCISNKNNSGKGVSGNGEGKKSFGDMLASEELSNEITNFITELSNYSDNPRIHQLADDMNQVRDKYDDINTKVNTFSRALSGRSMDEETQKMVNAYQNIEMGIAIGKALFGKEPSLEDQLSNSQLAVRKYILDVSESLETIHKTVSKVKPYRAQGMKYKDYISSKKNDIETYEALTSRERYLCHWYLNFDGYPNSQNMRAEYARLENMTVRQIQNEIQRIQDRSSSRKNIHLMSKEFSFGNTYRELKLNEEKLRDDIIIQYDNIRLQSNLNPDDVNLKLLLVETQKKYDSAYFDAIRKEDLNFLLRSKRYFISHVSEPERQSPLEYAAKLDRVKSFRFILNEEKEINHIAILRICAINNSLGVFNTIIEDAKLDNQDKKLLINEAFKNSSDNIFAALIENQVKYEMIDLNATQTEEPQKELSRLLTMSAIRNNDIRLLNEADNIKELNDKVYFLEVMKYSGKKYNETIEELITRIDDKNLVNSQERGLLHHFVEIENDYFVELLISKGYNQTIQDETGNSALDYFIQRLESESYSNSELSEVHFDLKAKSSSGIPLIHHLLHIDRDNFEKYINRDSSLINVKGLYGWTALHYAAKRGDLKTCRTLIDKGANKQIKDDWGRTPFEVAKERVGAQYSYLDKVSNDEYKEVSNLLKIPFKQRNFSLNYILRR